MANSDSNRVICYVEDFSESTLNDLLTCAQNNYLTHILISLFHVGYNGSPPVPYVHINDTPPDDPVFDNLWNTVPQIQSYGVKVMGSLGGGGVGDYRDLFATPTSYNIFKSLLESCFQTYNLDGLDLDIEESNNVVNTDNVQKFVEDLQSDLGGRSGGFLVTSAPVASALINQQESMSPYVDYVKLFDLFDWYNVQFYNGWGSITPSSPPWPPDYEAVVSASSSPPSPNKIVLGTPTSPNDASGYVGLSELTTIISNLSQVYSSSGGFGGVDGWVFEDALDDQSPPQVDPVGWAKALQEAM
jgi:Glycosyl hydrolases family 18